MIIAVIVTHRHKPHRGDIISGNKALNNDIVLLGT